MGNMKNKKMSEKQEKKNVFADGEMVSAEVDEYGDYNSLCGFCPKRIRTVPILEGKWL